MDISVLIGNGVDISNGLETSYKNFFDSKIKSNNKPNNLMYDYFKKNDESHWSDMEKSIGDLSSCYKDEVSKFETDKEKLQNDLLEYLQCQHTQITENDIETKKRNLFFFINNLNGHITTNEDQQKFGSFVPRWEINDKKNAGDWTVQVNFITLNYTDLLEKKLYTQNDNSGGTFVEDTSHLFTRAKIMTPDTVLHPHGTIEKYMVFGLDNPSQLKNSNKKFAEYSVKGKLISKSELNDYEEASEDIAMSNLILVIGASLGETDDHWIEEIIMQLINNPLSLVIIDSFNNDNSPKKSILQTGKYNATVKEPFKRYFNNANHQSIRDMVQELEGGFDGILERILVGNFTKETSSIVNLNFSKQDTEKKTS